MLSEKLKKLLGRSDEVLSKVLGPPTGITVSVLPKSESNLPANLSIILLDASGSMNSRAIDVRLGYHDYFDSLKTDELTSISVLTAIVFIASTVKLIPFQPVIDFTPPEFTFGGSTMLGQGITEAVDATEKELRRLAEVGRPVNRVSITIITDGKPTDPTDDAVAKLRKLESLPFVQVFPIAVDEDAIEFLKKTSAKSEVALLKSEPGSFKHLLRWLADVQATYSRSRPGEKVALPPADSWKED